MLSTTLSTYRGVSTVTVSRAGTPEKHDAINGNTTDGDDIPQTRKPRGFASVVQSLVDDIIKPSNQED